MLHNHTSGNALVYNQEIGLCQNITDLIDIFFAFLFISIPLRFNRVNPHVSPSQICQANSIKRARGCVVGLSHEALDSFD